MGRQVRKSNCVRILSTKGTFHAMNGSYAIAFALMVALYGLKALLLRFVRSPILLALCFFAGVALLVPVTWLISPDWNNEHVARIAIWVGDPIGILLVPCVSFLFDLLKGRHDMSGWRLRVPLEILVAGSVWFYAWAWIQFLVLGWVWI